MLGPASKGQFAEEAGVNKHTSGIPKLLHRKGVGHQVHDAEQLVSARPVGQRRSGRANVRGEMTVVKGDLGEVEMDKFSVSKPPSSPERERGRGQRSRYLQASNPALEYDRNLAKVHEFLSINHYAHNVDNQDDDGYDSDADLEPVCGPDDPDWMDIDNHEHVRKVDDKYIFDFDAQIELTPEEQAACKYVLSSCLNGQLLLCQKIFHVFYIPRTPFEPSTRASRPRQPLYQARCRTRRRQAMGEQL